jgi:hypothetical protein
MTTASKTQTTLRWKRNGYLEAFETAAVAPASPGTAALSEVRSGGDDSSDYGEVKKFPV